MRIPPVDEARESFEAFRVAPIWGDGVIPVGVTERHRICNYVERLEREVALLKTMMEEPV